ncbi:signal peptide peptidase SppA [Anaplasma marginale]|uniref:Signal peptide peptidase SppA n=1 Tax=Anaplasma marginale TaxID=770 RepID=A0A643CL15_ANAMA|nr:signal peptide peptidase SppA [Anaplasma marginale]AXW84239.1 signal peptide peptidase SppA [Anaplasma marginale]AXW85163.1 signal peptide peptidase SppA [Anaplasma marginale]KAA8472708.1 signal peptide peptidase SppA [Anaplasma marginale]KAA8474182.1 signal peptide peptidase SppA [Anaplasma marginale]KAB0450656.1 signal peptide peptidase SppA [Anaplasma marginale]
MLDHLLKMEALHSRVLWWRASFFLVVCLLLLVMGHVDYSRVIGTLRRTHDYVARVRISGEIGRSRAREAMLARLAESDSVKALVLRIDSPGGTVGDSEALYQQIREIALKKPVVAVLGNVAASGGYMAAIAADHVVARHGTITGSIGVVSQYIGVAEAAGKLGIALKSIKTAPLKSNMSPLEELSPEGESIIQGVVDDFHVFFVGLVAERRGFTPDKVSAVSDGRIYTGAQALQAGLIDAIGGEKEALEWLKTQRDVDVRVVKDVDYQRIDSGLPAFFSSAIQYLHVLLFG